MNCASSPLRDTFIDRAAFDAWFDRYRARLRTEAVDDALRQQQMQRVNPAIVLRNWLAQRAIDAAEQGDMAELHITNLLANIITYVQLAAMLFLTVAVAEVDDQMFRQIKFMQRVAGGGNIFTYDWRGRRE